MFEIDHLAITAATLPQAAAWAERLFGVPLSPGGQHDLMGTHNRLLSLGPGEYLEVITPDPDAPIPPHPRWFGLDHPPQTPGLGAWIARVPNLDAALAQAPDGAGRATDLARGNYRWRMGIAPSGLTPFDGLFPPLIEWQGQAHPAQTLPDHGIRLVALTLSYPQADDLRASLPMDDPRIRVTQGPAHMTARFSSPHGDITL